ncbi:MAG TPA: hypothetical protein DCP92_05790 [Nitrospiraceae bacterium]|jgi:hypothetical protein|nr:hypothetical protein [Nitrospiraceae bacterium]
METDLNPDKLDSLMAAARSAELYDSQREYGFETRVMAKIRAKREAQMPFPLWAWRLIPVFVSIVIFLGIWTYASESTYTADLSAVTNIGNEEVILTAFLTGE